MLSSQCTRSLAVLRMPGVSWTRQ
uniref:Uncharacterized protein n=1 Tax=Arundo donax TaxID=35708 RepID=A0A0A9C4M3_ARUDO